VHWGIEDGYSGVPVPLADASGKTIAALSVGLKHRAATPQIIGKMIVPVLREAARSIAASL
jgi:DNA-binding IclR family transcriptional regulator